MKPPHWKTEVQEGKFSFRESERIEIQNHPLNLQLR